ncbi:MAG TPA: DUF1801 domain-containing protein [Saprospiraceae bacterium]|nr:DUF1801 domain-containing protein [Saprospiraceae bacterium]
MPEKKISKKRTAKPSEAEQVADYMNRLEHPLKTEIETLRQIIKNADSRISERIKWNAPSYYSGADLLTFNPRMQNQVHLVFHHPEIVRINSPLLEGDYKDRRMVYFQNMEAIHLHREELEKILREYLDLAEKTGR